MTSSLLAKKWVLLGTVIASVAIVIAIGYLVLLSDCGKVQTAGFVYNVTVERASVSPYIYVGHAYPVTALAGSIKFSELHFVVRDNVGNVMADWPAPIPTGQGLVQASLCIKPLENCTLEANPNGDGTLKDTEAKITLTFEIGWTWPPDGGKGSSGARAYWALDVQKPEGNCGERGLGSGTLQYR